MVEYSSYYLDPRPYAQRYVNSLQEQARYADTQRQQQFANQLAMRQEGRAERKLTLEEGRFDTQKQQLAREVAKGELQMAAQIASGINPDDPMSYQSARQVVKRMVQSKMLSPMWYETLPEETPSREDIVRMKQQMRAAVGQENWTEPTAVKGGRGAIGQTELGSGKAATLVGQAPPVGGGGGAARTPQTLDQRIGDQEQFHKNAQKYFYQDEDNKYLREGPLTNPNLYMDAKIKSVEANEKDKDLLRQGKEPHYVQDILDWVQEAEAEWQAIEAGLPDPTDPANITNKDGKPVQFRDTKTGDVYQVVHKKWQIVKHGRVLKVSPPKVTVSPPTIT